MRWLIGGLIAVGVVSVLVGLGYLLATFENGLDALIVGCGYLAISLILFALAAILDLLDRQAGALEALAMELAPNRFKRRRGAFHPILYRITGRDAETGDERSVEVEAQGEDGARRLALEQGLDEVYRVEPIS